MRELYRDDIRSKMDPPGRDEYGKWIRPEYRPVDRNIDRLSSPLIEKKTHYERPEPRIEMPADIRSAESIFSSRLKKLTESGI